MQVYYVFDLDLWQYKVEFYGYGCHDYNIFILRTQAELLWKDEIQYVCLY